LPITLYYQQRYTSISLETASDGSYEPLQMTFLVIM
jgi:hypothetical protein